MKPEDITLDWLQARVIERDGCWLWTGAKSKDGYNPKCKMDGKTVFVRRMLYELIKGKPVPSGFDSGVSCNCKLCVHPEHLTAKRRGKELKGKTRPAHIVMKMSMSMRAKSKIPEETIKEIMQCNESLRKAEKKYGISMSYIGALRRGEWRRDFSNPFTGLGA